MTTFCRNHTQLESEPVEAAAPNLSLLKQQQPGEAAAWNWTAVVSDAAGRFMQQAAKPSCWNRRAGHAEGASAPQQLHPSIAVGDGKAVQAADSGLEGKPAFIRHHAASQRS